MGTFVYACVVVYGVCHEITWEYLLCLLFLFDTINEYTRELQQQAAQPTHLNMEVEVAEFQLCSIAGAHHILCTMSFCLQTLFEVLYRKHHVPQFLTVCIHFSLCTGIGKKMRDRFCLPAIYASIMNKRWTWFALLHKNDSIDKMNWQLLDSGPHVLTAHLLCPMSPRFNVYSRPIYWGFAACFFQLIFLAAFGVFAFPFEHLLSIDARTGM